MASATLVRRAGDRRWVMVAVLVGVLAAAFGLQLAGYGDSGRLALSDLPHLFRARGIGPGHLPYLDRPLEYPVLSGALLFVAAYVWPSPFGVLAITALGSALLCVLMVELLAGRFGTRAWRWVLAVPLVLYAYQNWDVFAIAPLVLGLLWFERGRDTAAGAAIGVGAAVKLFPAVAVPVLAAIRWSSGDRRGSTRLVAGAVAAFLLVNLPVAVANPSGWWSPFRFQSRRAATWGDAWFYLYHRLPVPAEGVDGARIANAVALVALAGALTWLTIVTARRRLDPFAAAGAAVAIFLLCNKVYSPTYDLWLVAFFVMVPLSRRLWVGFCAVDLAVFAVVYGYFEGMHSIAIVHQILPVLVAVRTVLLLVMIRECTRVGPAPLRVADVV